jgi:hypothetical protein
MVAVLLLVVDPVVGLSALNQSKITNHKLLILGLGSVGLQVAQVALTKVSEGDGTIPIQVVGTKRNKAKTIEEDRVRYIPFEPHAVRQDLMGSKESEIDMTSHVLFTIPLQRDPDPLMEAVWLDVRNWWTENPQGKLGILSTTGVYGDQSGNFVIADSPLLCNGSAIRKATVNNRWTRVPCVYLSFDVPGSTTRFVPLCTLSTNMDIASHHRRKSRQQHQIPRRIAFIQPT